MRIVGAVAVIMRVVVAFVGVARGLDGFHDITSHHEADTGFFQTGTQLVQIAFKPESTGEKNPGFGDGFPIPRRGFVNVRIDSGFDDFGHLHAFASDFPGQIRHDCAKRRHP